MTVNAGTNRRICTGGSFTLGGSPTATGGTAPLSYSWSPATGLSSTTSANPVASPLSTTTYTVTVTDSAGCTATRSVTISISPTVVANAGADRTICNGASTTIGGSPSGSGGTAPLSYSWSPSTGLS